MTRCTTHFIDSSWMDKAEAIIYRHCDGYPEGNGTDILKFLAQCKALKDSRLEDVSFLAARFVVFLSIMFARDYNPTTGRYSKSKVPFDFISVGIMNQDPTDIDYRYVVDCNKIGDDGLPEVKAYKVSLNDDGTDKSCVEVPIPAPKAPRKKK